MHPLIKKILLEIIKESQSSLGRKPSQDNEHYLDKILMVLYSDIKWKYLEGPLYHDTYRKKFQYWANELNVFEKTHEIICTLLQDKFYNHNLLNKLFMDSSDILNKNGYECTGRSKKYKFKKATKINIITDQYGIILAIKIVPANKNDSILTEETLDNIKVKIIHSRKYPKYLITDKGYINKKKKKLEKKINLIYPDRKNCVNSPYNYTQNIKRKELLKKRYINENAFSWLKNSKRTTIRCDRLLCTFKGFIYLQALKHIGTKIDILKINLS
jgi:hypothetical protein